MVFTTALETTKMDTVRNIGKLELCIGILTNEKMKKKQQINGNGMKFSVPITNSINSRLMLMQLWLLLIDNIKP